jgi:hypothetical protein
MIAYDREVSTADEPRYFVYDGDRVVIYKGTYTQCLIVEGGLINNLTLEEIKDKCGNVLDAITS